VASVLQELPQQDRSRPNLDSLSSINPDGSRNPIHPARVRGRFQVIKNAIWTVLIAIYLVLPWVHVGGAPAVLIDIQKRHFYLFGNTFNAQDFWLAFFFLTGIGFTLIVLSALWGRLWCGYGCPQTVFLEGVFRRIESWIEGTPRKRRELDRAPWTASKVLKRSTKYLVFLAISLVLSHTFLGYFVPIEEVLAAVTGPPTENWVAFLFVAAFTAAIFVNFTWFREQLCIVICPYGRLQGVLYDPHTINVGYDRIRGEPRGKVGAEGAGDCIDCFRCVAVCPTGIDIRNGTQLECVGCANCIDACDEVMDRVGRPRGLVRYDSQAGLEGHTRRFLRPRLALYVVLLAVGTVVFSFAASSRTPFEANLLRLDTSPYTIEGDVILNSFSLHLENKQPAADTFYIEAPAREGIQVVIASRTVDLPSLDDQRIPIFVRIDQPIYERGMRLELTVSTANEERKISAPLLGPRGKR